MPTNDERREIAAKLRELRVPLRFSLTCSLSEIIHGRDGCASYDSCDKCEADVLRALVDLIEPEERTCQRGTEMFSHAYPNEIVCDSDCVSTYVFPLTCGHEVELLENEWPNYCPVCGAKVVDDHA